MKRKSTAPDDCVLRLRWAMLVLILFCAATTTSGVNASINHQCVSAVQLDFRSCTPDIIQDLPETSCREDVEACHRGFNVSFLNVEPFMHHRFKSLIKQLVRHCCGQCARLNVLSHLENVTEVSYPEVMKNSHIVYPVLGRVKATSLYGYYFVPFWDIPGSYYVTEKHTKSMIVRSVLLSCQNHWPFLAIMLLMSVIAGFIVWVIETWVNKEMFPRTFLIGLFDGFWWSFVSMTTVGYGDKIPKFLASRVFSIVWILVGLTICSMFTASLTTDITKATSADIPSIAGKTVGVIKQRLHDLALVANHGGSVRETRGDDLLSDVIELVDMLRNDEIDGFLLDKFVYAHALHDIDSLNISTTNYTQQRQYFLNQTVLTDKTYEGDKLSFGILVREHTDYEFFKDFIMDNRLSILACSSIALNLMHNKLNHKISNSEESANIYSSENSFLMNCLMMTTTILILILCFGMTYEIVRRKVNISAWRDKLLRTKKTVEKTGCCV